MVRSPTLPELRFVVVGAESTGKSTFIHHALDLKKPLQMAVASKKMSLEGEVFMIRLTEINLAEVSVDGDFLVTWPHLQDSADSRIDGVLALYDVSRRETLGGIQNLLSACSKGNLPCVLVACKCDVPRASRKVDPREIEKACLRQTGIEGCQTHIDRPDTHKRCISVVLRNVISNRTWRGEPRARALTTPRDGASGSGTQEPVPRTTPHTRAISERVVPTLSNCSPTEDAEVPVPLGANHAVDSIPAPGYYIPGGTGGPSAKDERAVESDPETPQPTPLADRETFVEDGRENAEGTDQLTRPRSRLRPGTPITIANSLIDADGEPAPEPSPPKPPPSKTQPSIRENSAEGYSLDELVDRLVSLPMTREDATFNDAFLCLYRKFAAPAQLLGALFQRWEALDESDEPRLLTLHSQLRIVAILAHWVSDYPGDLDYALTRHYLMKFCEMLAENRAFAIAAREIMDMLELAVPDNDLEWSVTDSSLGDATIQGYFAQFPALSEPTKSSNSEDWLDGISQSKLSIDLDTESLGHRRYPSASMSLTSLDRSATFSVGTFSSMHEAVEAAKNQAELLTPLNRTPLTKLQWRQLMEYGDEELASEMTRMDWIMYSALQPRDLIRHVSLSTSAKEKSRSLEHLNRMINHFNHISFWTASMILLRDKAKHRAQALEKFIEVARKLRVQNNYNSLAAIIAGISGTSVHRLAQTRDLVPQNPQIEFMKLEILMGTRKGYFAYRLAWENTVGEKVPFLPLHIRDLVATEEGNPTFIGKNKDRINWKKFSIMGDTIVGIQESQGTPYPPIPRNAEMQRLILDGRVSMDEDDIYERSVQVEPRGPNEVRRKFNFFAR